MAAEAARPDEGQFVTFSLGDEELAVPIAWVQEIVRPPDLTPVPNAPNYVIGLANLRGAILPVMSLRLRLAMPARPNDDAARVIVLSQHGMPTGMLVDGVSEVLHVDPKVIESTSEMMDGIKGDFLRGVARIEKGDRLLLIIDVEKLLADLKPPEPDLKTDAVPGRPGEGSARTVAKPVDDEEQLVSFSIAGEEFAVDIVQVQEIVRVGDIRAIPRSPSYFCGVMPLRQRLLPVIDLKSKLRLSASKDCAPVVPTPDDDDVDARRIVVVDSGVPVGLQVDSVSEVVRLKKHDIDAPPAILGTEQGSRLRGVGKIDNGRRMLMLLNLDNLFSESDRRSLAEVPNAYRNGEARQGGREIADDVQIVCFRIDREEYGLDIMRVQEVIRIDQITAVPRAPSFVEGIVNLRGDILPVIDLCRRVGLPPLSRNDHNRIVVVDIHGQRTGIVVEAVNEVLRIPRRQIHPPLSVLANLSADYIDGIAQLRDGQRTILLVNIDSLFNDSEQEALQSFVSPSPSKRARTPEPAPAPIAVAPTPEPPPPISVVEEIAFHEEPIEEVAAAPIEMEVETAVAVMDPPADEAMPESETTLDEPSVELDEPPKEEPKKTKPRQRKSVWKKKRPGNES